MNVYIGTKRKKVEASYMAYVILLSFYWTNRTILGYIRGMIHDVPVLLDTYNIILGVIVSISWLLLLQTVLSRLQITGLIIILVFATIFLRTSLNMQLSRYNNAGGFFLNVFPLFFLALCTPLSKERFRSVLSILNKLSFYAVVLSFIYIFYYLYIGRDWAGTDHMQAAYSVFLSEMYIIWYRDEKHDKENRVVAVLGFAYLFAMGNRGAILGIIVWYMVNYLTRKETSTIKKCAFVLIIMILGAIIFGGFIDNAIIFIARFFHNSGLNTRIFEYFLRNDLTNSNGRDLLMTQCFSYLRNYGMYFTGFYNDRAILNGIYAHNLVIELFVDFGYVVGGLAILMLSFFLVRSILHTKDKYFRQFLLLFITALCVKLMVSSSFLEEPFFFFMLGLIVIANRKTDMRFEE